MRGWFDDPALVAQLPPEYRLLAAYARRLAGHGEIRGMWRGWVTIAAARRLLHARTWRLVTVNGTPLAVDLLDPRAMWAFEEARGEDAEGRLLAELLGPGDSFLDVGANHGSYALLASRLVGPAGRVLAFEPQQRLAGLIRHAFAAAGRDPDDVFAVACSNRDGDAVLVVPPRHSGCAALDFSPAAEGGRVRTARLDALLAGVDLPGRLVVKLDVEGAELPVLRGATATLRARKPAIVFEVSPTASAQSGIALGDLLDELVALGYTFFSTPETYPAVKPAAGVDLGREHNAVALTEPPAAARPRRAGPPS